MLSRRIFLASLLTGCALLAVACGGGGGVVKEADDADAAWDKGDKAAAVAKYKEMYSYLFLPPQRKPPMLARVVEYELKAGHKDEAKKWVERGIQDGVKVEYQDPASKELLAAVEKEHAGAAAARKAEEEKRAKQEAADRAKREAEEKAAHERANPATAEKYAKIKAGMTYKEVYAVVGEHGEEQASSSVAGISTQIIAWSNEDGSNMLITFQNGRVTSKAQAGLR